RTGGLKTTLRPFFTHASHALDRGAACIAAGLRYAALHTVLGRATRMRREVSGRRWWYDSTRIAGSRDCGRDTADTQAAGVIRAESHRTSCQLKLFLPVPKPAAEPSPCSVDCLLEACTVIEILPG